MKKIYLLLIATLSMFLSISSLNALNVNVEVEGERNIEEQSTFSLDIKVTGTNVWGIMMSLSYDKTKLELLNYESSNGFTATVGSNIVLDSSEGHNDTFKVITLNFKAKKSFVPGQTSIISLTNIKASSNTEIMKGADVSTEILVKLKEGETPYILGDSNSDGIVDINDVMLTLRLALELIPSNENYIKLCDVNGNGKIDMLDTLYILRVALNLE